ncbi:MAG: hypothetical protein Q8R31_06140 [Candidatus Omnitrophota bacterium]|nr:hypothetical protein [Candidatus Omnitrophota bacterium]
MNKRGTALILAYLVITALTILSTAFVSGNISESNMLRRHLASGQAFWIAEAGLNDALYNMRISSSWQPSASPVNYGGGTYSVQKVDLGSTIELRSTGTHDNVSRFVKGALLRIPTPFENTLSVGGNLSLTGLLARVEVYDKTRISGTYSQSRFANGWFEDKQVGVSSQETTIAVPDYDESGTSDEFSDFLLFGRDAVQSYSADEVVYIQTNGTVNIFPDEDLVGKKIIFVEGSSPGAGDVNIFFDTSWQEGEDLTIISTGTVTYLEPLQFQEDARLSIIAWDDYRELSVFRSQHESVIYAHDDANFVDVLDWGSTTGNIIVNDDMSLLEVLTYEKYYYSDKAINGDLPPGFQGLCSANGVLSSKLSDWQEW